MLFLCESPTAKGRGRKTGPSWQENGIREALRFGFVAKITNFKSFRPSFLFLFIFLIRQASGSERRVGRSERIRERGNRRRTGRATDFDAALNGGRPKGCDFLARKIHTSMKPRDDSQRARGIDPEGTEHDGVFGSVTAVHISLRSVDKKFRGECGISALAMVRGCDGAMFDWQTARRFCGCPSSSPGHHAQSDRCSRPKITSEPTKIKGDLCR